jgi:peptidoglycan/xylan/chitin deacetylase (PgdA/CDA1 family)
LLASVPNKREFLARCFCRSGIVRLLEHTFSAWRPGLVVFTYHRIADPSTDLFYGPVISATPESFRAQVEWLRSRFRVITLDELILMLESDSVWRESVALLTFDDGYRDNFQTAVPILREWHVPATFFIPTAFLESPQLSWWDHVAYVIKQTRVQQLTLEPRPGGAVAPIEISLNTMSRQLAVRTIIQAFLDKTIVDERWFLDRLQAQAEVSVDSQGLAQALFMSWSEVQQLAELGPELTIGSHAHSHRKLTDLDAQSQCDELAISKHILEGRLGRHIRALAYPYGWPGTYDERTKSLAAENGYSIAFASRPSINHSGKTDPFEVSRLGVGSTDSTRLLRARTEMQVAFNHSFL